MSKVIGKVAQIIGPVVDVEFNGVDVELPKIYDSLEITKKDGKTFVNGSEIVTSIETSNGIIHVIGDVLLPK